eukprot:4347548-Pleurochrysis_carterae.AAC.2
MTATPLTQRAARQASALRRLACAFRGCPSAGAQRAHGTLHPYHADDWVNGVHVSVIEALIGDFSVRFVRRFDARAPLSPFEVLGGQSIGSEERHVRLVHVFVKTCPARHR